MFRFNDQIINPGMVGSRREYSGVIIDRGLTERHTINGDLAFNAAKSVPKNRTRYIKRQNTSEP